LFVVRNGIQTGLDDPAENVLGGALPNQVAPKLKLIIDNLVLPGSAVIAGLGLLLAEALFGASSIRFLAGVGVVACLGFLAAALWVRSLYVSAIYSRLRSHTLSLSDLELALGRPGAKAVEELKAGARGDDPNLREFAARALARVAPESFLGLVEELAVSTEPALRRLAYELPPPGSLSLDQLEKAAGDGDPWVEAAAAVAGAHLQPPWSRSPEILARLDSNGAEIARAASVWAAAEIGDHHEVAEALADLRPGGRLAGSGDVGGGRGDGGIDQERTGRPRAQSPGSPGDASQGRYGDGGNGHPAAQPPEAGRTGGRGFSARHAPDLAGGLRRARGRDGPRRPPLAPRQEGFREGGAGAPF